MERETRHAGFKVNIPSNFPDDYCSDVDELVQELEALAISYVSNLKYLLEAGKTNLTTAKVILAQNMKSRIMLHQSHETLEAVDSVITGLLTATDIGYPEFERPNFDD